MIRKISQRGASLLEYAGILSLMAVVVIAITGMLGYRLQCVLGTMFVVVKYATEGQTNFDANQDGSIDSKDFNYLNLKDLGLDCGPTS